MCNVCWLLNATFCKIESSFYLSNSVSVSTYTAAWSMQFYIPLATHFNTFRRGHQSFLSLHIYINNGSGRKLSPFPTCSFKAHCGCNLALASSSASAEYLSRCYRHCFPSVDPLQIKFINTSAFLFSIQLQHSMSSVEDLEHRVLTVYWYMHRPGPSAEEYTRKNTYAKKLETNGIPQPLGRKTATSSGFQLL